MNYLAVCMGNQLRSPYVAQWINEYCAARGIRAEARSAGIQENSPTRLDFHLLEWSDTAVIMQEDMKWPIIKKSEDCTKTPDIFCIDVPDMFIPDWYQELSRHVLIDHSYDEITPPEADRRLKIRRRGERFGSRFFSKVLEARLAPYIEAHK